MTTDRTRSILVIEDDPGLGLAIVLATVERYAGTASFESSDAGTRFQIRLPLV